MKSGLGCCRAKVAVILLIVGVAWVSWWWRQPKTDEELFLVRCSSCHELRVQRLCEFEARLRPYIVNVMREQHGADQVIDSDEAIRIQRYLREKFRCR